MDDYKHTLNLPNTDFPMKANLANREPDILNVWNRINLYEKLRLLGKNRPLFILHDGPPYANGDVHIGHMLNKTLKDMIVKSKTLSGYDAPFVPGWDCHGLPIELNVEKKHGKVGQKISAKEFRKYCRQHAQHYIEAQKKAFIRLGVFGDWAHSYLTMDFNYEANIIRALAQLTAHGYLKRGARPVHWCVDCASALAEAEVEYAEKISPAIDVAFQCVDANAVFNLFNFKHVKSSQIFIPIWTTTPWTLPANQAVAVHPHHEYILVEATWNQQHTYFILAKELAEQMIQRYQLTDVNFLNEQIMHGAALEFIQLQHPLFNKQVPILLGEHVTMDTGTGAVHTAPAHGEEDFSLGTTYNLEITQYLDGHGRFMQNTPIFAGENLKQANEHIIQLLAEKNLLLANQKITHSYPHCWRHKTPVIFRATPQWFIELDNTNLRQNALEQIQQIKFIPASGKERIQQMIETRPNWCISRQRYWGVPLSLFVHRQTGELHPHTAEIMHRVADHVAQEGIDIWYEKDEQYWLGDDANDYEKINDILDVWFDSGVSHFAVLNTNSHLSVPADLYLEGADQHRGWFQSSLLTGTGIYGHAPYRGILTHGYTVDAQGRKMSKSLGNVIAPDKIINTLGADILRLWVASTDYRAEISVSEEIFQRSADIYRRLRNTARFLLANLHDFDPATHQIVPEQMLALDRYIVVKAKQLQNEIIEHYDQYQFHMVVQKIHHFCSIELGSFYLDVIKDRQYTLQKDSVARRSAQTAMYHLIHAFVRWIAPILSFTAEEINQFIPGQKAESVFLTQWYDGFAAIEVDHYLNEDDWNTIMLLRDQVNKELEIARQSGDIGSGLAAHVHITARQAQYELLKKLTDELRFILITSDADLILDNTIEHPILVHITPAKGEKCERCWHRRPEVGASTQHPQLCMRCIENIEGAGEKRSYA